MKTRLTPLALPLVAALVACAGSPVAAPPGDVPWMTVAAQGTQIYDCRITVGAAPAWTFVAPEAELFDADGRRIGRHGAGPMWQHTDGSGFVGTVRARAPSPAAGAIPWLLLAAQAQGPDGVFSRVSSVQRVNTVGGEAPAGGCGPATVGARVQMAYRADYVLHVPQSAPTGTPARGTPPHDGPAMAFAVPAWGLQP